jgi:hypothetical protein
VKVNLRCGLLAAIPVCCREKCTRRQIEVRQMSSRSGPVAAHNLVFSDGVVRLECAATGAVVAERVPGDDPVRIGAALHGLAPHCDGPVVAVLPAEVFRAVEVPRGPAALLVARLALARRALSRRADAERIPGAASLAAAFGFGPRALALATGPADRRGRVAVVAVERRTLEEAARFLAAHGIALAAVRPDPGLLPGRVLPRLPLAAAGPARSPVRRAVAPGPWLAGLRARLQGQVSRRAALAGGAAVAAVLAGALALAGRDAPVAEVPGPLATLPDMPVLEAAADAAAPEVTAALPQPLAPKPRRLTGLELLTEEAPPRRPEAPAALAEVLAALDAPALASVGSRSVPPDVVADARRAAEAAQARADATRLAAVSPVPRPVAESVPASATASDPAGRPAPRPGDAGGAAAAAPSAPSAPAAGPQASAGDPAAQRPQPRPLSEAEEVAQAVAAALAAAPPVQMAALDPAVSGAAAGLAAAATAGPRPAPRQAAAVPAAAPAAAPQAARAPAPAAQPVQARMAPAAVRPAPQAASRQMAALPQQAAPAAAAPRVQAPAVAPRTQAPAVAPQRAQPQPAQPQRQAARPPQPQPQVQRQQAQPQRQAAPAAAAGGSGNISLIGVFGASNQRHALVRLPNGSVQRVRPGETVAGAQVAAVGADNVRLRTNGGDRVLRLPD